MLTFGQASVLRGTRRWKGERRGEREGEESPPRVTQAHSHSSGRKLNRRPAHAGLYVPTPPGHPFPTWTRLYPTRTRLYPTLSRVLVTRVSAATSTLTRQASHPSTAVPAGCLVPTT